jgi:hypothetical protein
MAGATHYPKASKHYSTAYPGVDMGDVSKVLLHSTEGPGWPDYDGGAKRPTLTYHPKTREWREHGRLDYSARALQDPSGTPVRENRDRVVQIEIIGTCDPKTHKAHPDWPYMPELTSANLDDLAAFLAFMHTEWHVPLVAAPLWLPYDASYGNSKARMSSAVYDAFMGLLGHMHASGNVHGDPGLIAAATIVARARVLVAPKTPTTIQPAVTGGKDSPMIRIVTEVGHYFYAPGNPPTPMPNGVISAALAPASTTVKMTEALRKSLRDYELAANRDTQNALVAALTPVLERTGTDPAELRAALQTALAGLADGPEGASA